MRAGRGAAPAGFVTHTEHSGGGGAPPGANTSPRQELARRSRTGRPGLKRLRRARKPARNAGGAARLSPPSPLLAAGQRRYDERRRVGEGKAMIVSLLAALPLRESPIRAAGSVLGRGERKPLTLFASGFALAKQPRCAHLRYICKWPDNKWPDNDRGGSPRWPFPIGTHVSDRACLALITRAPM